MDPYDPDFDPYDNTYTVPDPAKAPDPTVIDPVTGDPIPYPSSGTLPPYYTPQSGATPPGMPPMGNLQGTINFMPFPPPLNQTTKPVTPAVATKYPVLVTERITKQGRPDRVYVDALPDTITADANDVAKHGGIDEKGRFCMQFHNAPDVVYIRHGNEPNTWDRLYGTIQFSLRGDAVEEPEDYENKWGPSVWEGTGDKPNYIHD